MLAEGCGTAGEIAGMNYRLEARVHCAPLQHKHTQASDAKQAALDAGKQRRHKLILEAQALVASMSHPIDASAAPKPPDAAKSKDCDLAALAARAQREGGGDSAPAARLTPAKANSSPTVQSAPASVPGAVPPEDDLAARLQRQQEREERARKLADRRDRLQVARLASRLQRQQEPEKHVRKLAESNAAAAEAKDSQASNAQAAVELEYKRKIAEELAKQKAKEAAEHAEQGVREAEAERVLAGAEQNATKQRAQVEIFERWRDVVVEERQIRTKTLKVVQRLMNRALQEGLERWRDRAAEEKQMKAKALKVVQRLMSSALVGYFERWRDQTAAAKEREQQQENAKPQTHNNAGASGLCKTGLPARRRVFVKLDFLRGDEPPAEPTAASEERERERARSLAFTCECGQSTGAQDQQQAESTATGSTP